MYYILYPFLYLVSLLPFRVLYWIADGIYILAFHIFKYRRDIVLDNIRKAFPGKEEKEIIAIAKEFYHNFIDSLVESIKFITITRKTIEKRGQGEYDLINELVARGRNVHVMAGHQFNWEYGNLLYAMHLRIPFVGIYMMITNKALDRIFYDIRGSYGTVLISARDFKNKMHQVFNNQYVLGLAADQNPGDPRNAYWMNFMGRPAPFVTGPAKGAIKNNTAVVYVGFHKDKKRRGYYKFSTTLLVENGADFSPRQLTAIYRDALEKTIRLDPSNYLWSHRRWKYEWKEEYGPIG